MGSDGIFGRGNFIKVVTPMNCLIIKIPLTTATLPEEIVWETVSATLTASLVVPTCHTMYHAIGEPLLQLGNDGKWMGK